MGFYKDIEIEIMSWQARGRSQDETYIYFKDYVTQEDVVRIFARDCDEETVYCLKMIMKNGQVPIANVRSWAISK
jgi:hypothetical protein